METFEQSFIKTDIIGSALVEVDEQGIIKLPEDCGIVTNIVYGNYKFAKIVESSPNYDFFRLEFWQDDNPKQVTVNWVIPLNTKQYAIKRNLRFISDTTISKNVS